MKNKKAFTLIELLIVIAIISIIAGIVFVALDPLSRFKDARDSRRWADASAIITAIKVSQIDNGGAYIAAINSTAPGTVYMIGEATTGCSTTPTCTTPVASTTACVDLTDLVTDGYLGNVPVSPTGAGDEYSSSTTGYTLKRESNGIITIAACENENTTEIKVVR